MSYLPIIYVYYLAKRRRGKPVKMYTHVWGPGLMNASRGPGPGSWVNRDVIPSPVTIEIVVNDVIAVSAWPSFACRTNARLTWNGCRALVCYVTFPPLADRRRDNIIVPQTPRHGVRLWQSRRQKTIDEPTG